MTLFAARPLRAAPRSSLLTAGSHHRFPVLGVTMVVLATVLAGSGL